MTLTETFDILVNKLQKTKIPAQVKLMSDEILIECGFNYPDKITNKIFDIIDNIDKNFNDFSICAKSSGGTIIKSVSVNGCPKRY